MSPTPDDWRPIETLPRPKLRQRMPVWLAIPGGGVILADWVEWAELGLVQGVLDQVNGDAYFLGIDGAEIRRDETGWLVTSPGAPAVYATHWMPALRPAPAHPNHEVT